MSKSPIAVVCVAVILSFIPTTTTAQAPDTTWMRTYGANAAALSLHELPDGGFVLGGHIKPEGESYRDMYIVRTYSNGDTLFTSEIGQDGRGESAVCLQPTADGGFILTGSRDQDEPFTSFSDIYLVKTDSAGERTWHEWYGNEDRGESPVWLVARPSGGYLIAGFFWQSPTGYDPWLIGTNEMGLMQSSDVFAWDQADYPSCIARTCDSGYAVCGFGQSFDDETDYDMYLQRLNPLGFETWSRSYGSGHPYDESANHICATSDGGFLLCGYRREYPLDKDIYVVKTDDTGGVVWTAQLGGTYHDEARCGIETVDGGYAVTASWYEEGNWKVALIKFNSAGDTLWTARIGDPDATHTPYSLVQTADNGFAIAGRISGDDAAAFLMKFESESVYDPYTVHADNLDLAISDTNPATDTLSVLLTEKDLHGQGIAGVKVMIDSLVHPAIEELTVTLSHGATEVTLIEPGVAHGANFVSTVLIDASPANLSDAQAPYTGTFRPHQQLGAFSQEFPNGDWVLTVSDASAGNDGTLQGWGISLLTDVALDVDNPCEVAPASYHLSQCYPNPFNPSTTIEFSLERRSAVELAVYNVLGQRVKSLVNSELPAGPHHAVWNGTNQRGNRSASGVYFYRLKTDRFTEVRKMLLLK